MIVRLKVKNFKNLRDVDIPFGPFTCIAGSNGVGKSNLFDAILFLSALANQDNTLVEAAYSIRDEKNKKLSGRDLRNIFYHDGRDFAETMAFEIDMLIPPEGIDHLGQACTATTTALKYRLELKYVERGDLRQPGLQILREDLLPIRRSEMKAQLQKFNAKNEWIESVVRGDRRNSTPFIETELAEKTVAISQDQVSGGKKRLRIEQLPRTVLSSANAIENPTMVLAKTEMESWRLIQFEPSALRSPDDMAFLEFPKVSVSGEHMPGTLYRLLNDRKITHDIGGHIGRRLSELIDDVFELKVDRDEKRDMLTLFVKGKDRTFFPARALSDGTLRFIALSIIEEDPDASGVICMEEPENGINPIRIPAILKLLNDIATDTTLPVDVNNPLRQVIINSHSPQVVAQLDESSLLFANYASKTDRSIILQPLADTWQTKARPDLIPTKKAQLLRFLNPVQMQPAETRPAVPTAKPLTRRVFDRPEVQLNLFEPLPA